MQISTRALVFSSLKYAEADLIVCCFTEDCGIKRYLLRGVLKSKKGKLRASLFQPLTLLQMEAFHKNKGTLERIKEAKISNPYMTLHSDIVKSSIVLFLAEMLKNSIQEEESNPSIFQYITESLQWLDANENVSHFHILFLLNLTHYLGFYPDISRKHFSYFNLLEGAFEKEPSNNYSMAGDEIELLKLYFGINFDGLSNIKITRQQRSKLVTLLLLYYKLHLQGYNPPKSLVVLNQIFN